MGRTTDERLNGKPGYLTTEFWKSLITSGLSLAVGLGAIGPSVPDKYRSIIDAAALLTAAASTGMYALSRGKTKAAAILATANVITTDKQIELDRQKNHLPTTPAPTSSGARKARTSVRE